MRVMGLRDSVGWLVWLFVSLISMLIISLLLSLLMKYGGILPYSDFGPIIIMMLCYSMSVLGFAFILAGLTSKATSGAMMAVLFYLVTFLPFIVILILEDSMEFWMKVILVRGRLHYVISDT